ncbi:hypothetical protein CKO11_13940 [Rhodobacter sp. TJ_12]|uniref:hypothetical protein n=1 Tax=Rhodobacter sp. TJ_12 TaxID=2029399 RepID=UPI001CBD266D|nr:hypothetical protein [Rhodobacter sp. TJ_12]MBZ4023559.1 hypothetical protein [Rhodobacter sp. TJ_12]
MQPISDQTTASGAPASGAATIFLATGARETECRARLRTDVSFSPFTPGALTEALAVGHDPVIIYRRAQPCVAQALEDGTAPSAALAAWCEEAAAILNTRQQARRRVLCVEETLLLSGTEDALERLLRHLPAPGALGEALAPTGPAVPSDDPLHMVLAAQILAISPQAQRLAAELEAASLFAPAPAPTAELLDALYAQSHDRSSLGTLAAERDLLLAHIAQIHTENSEAEARLKETLLQADARDQALTELREEAQKARAAHHDLTAERGVLLDHIRDLQEQTDSRGTRIQNLTDQVTALEADLDSSRQALRDARQQALETARKTAERETAALREQIRTLENRETSHREEVGGLRQARDREAARAKALQSEITAAKKHWGEILSQAEQRELALQEQLTLLRREYDKLIVSRSWKVTQPLRSANSLLSGRKNKDQ